MKLSKWTLADLEIACLAYARKNEAKGILNIAETYYNLAEELRYEIELIAIQDDVVRYHGYHYGGNEAPIINFIRDAVKEKMERDGKPITPYCHASVTTAASLYWLDDDKLMHAWLRDDGTPDLRNQVKLPEPYGPYFGEADCDPESIYALLETTLSGVGV